MKEHNLKYKYSVDYDGTLTTSIKKIYRKNVKFIKKNNKSFILNTGRTFKSAEEISKRLKLDNFSAANGSSIKVDGNILQTWFEIEDVIRILNRYPNRSVCFPSENYYIRKEVKIHPRYINKKTKYIDEPIKTTHFIISGNNTKPKNETTYGEEYSIECFSSKEGKATIFDHINNIDFHVGDGSNDITAKHKNVKLVALKNATDEYKQKADYISPFTNDEGIYKTIKWLEEEYVKEN